MQQLCACLAVQDVQRSKGVHLSQVTAAWYICLQVWPHAKVEGPEVQYFQISQVVTIAVIPIAFEDRVPLVRHAHSQATLLQSAYTGPWRGRCSVLQLAVLITQATHSS